MPGEGRATRPAISVSRATTRVVVTPSRRTRPTAMPATSPKTRPGRAVRMPATDSDMPNAVRISSRTGPTAVATGRRLKESAMTATTAKADQRGPGRGRDEGRGRA